MPWATGRGSLGLINQNAYGYSEPALYLPFIFLTIIIALAVITGIPSLLNPSKSIYGFFIICSGLLAGLLGFYIWMEIENSDVYFLVKIAEIKPDLGILLIILGGGVLFLDGLVYLR